MSLKRKNIQEELQPTVKLTSDGDLLVKNLLEKQLCTQSNLQAELHRSKIFIPSSEYRSVSNYASGVNSLEELKKTSQFIENLEEFNAAGLNEDDLNFYMNKDLGSDYLKQKHKNLDTISIENKLLEINAILNQHRKKKNTEKPSSNVAGRLQTECMLSIKPNSVETNLLKFALDNNKKMDETSGQNEHLKIIGRAFINSLNEDSNINIPKLQKKVQRRLRAMTKKIDSVPSTLEKPICEIPNLSPAKSTMWDVKNVETVAHSGRDQNEKEKKDTPLKSVNCIEIENLEQGELKPKTVENRYTIRNGIIVNLKDLIDYSQCEKLSVEEIKATPKFSDYSIGSPSKILYLKNIHSLSMNDLELLFKSFNFTTKSINILKGRMKGQAFVEMESCELANKAIEQINGIVLKNKPVIIQFSTKTELPKKD